MRSGRDDFKPIQAEFKLAMEAVCDDTNDRRSRPHHPADGSSL
jgi:hypothetical protein